MEFKEKYISLAENVAKPDEKRVLISNDAFALGEMIENLINKLEQTRITR